jgi:hypothetical protein
MNIQVDASNEKSNGSNHAGVVPHDPHQFNQPTTVPEHLSGEISRHGSRNKENGDAAKSPPKTFGFYGMFLKYIVKFFSTSPLE